MTATLSDTLGPLGAFVPDILDTRPQLDIPVTGPITAIILNSLRVFASATQRN